MNVRANVEPWLVDYDAAVAGFDWNDAWADLDGTDETRGVNIADLALDRHVRAGRGDHVALRWIGRDHEDVDAPVDLTYTMLASRTNRFAGALRHDGFGPGTAVASLTGRIPDLYVSALGSLKAQCTFTPLFSAFGPDPIAQRLHLGRIRVLVTTPTLYRRKVAGIVNRLPDLELVLICGATEDHTAGSTTGRVTPRVVSMGSFLCDGTDSFDIGYTDPETPALLHFTSGTTGTPKGAVHVHGAVVTHHLTGRLVLDLHPDDVFWCTADPGWVTGTSYGIIAPLTNGVTSIVDEADFDAERWYRILERHAVDVFYTAPTAIRMLQRLGPELASTHDFGALRLVASVGEPLDADAVRWCEDVFGVPVLDTWWQTETGGIMIANYRSQPVRPGSMGRPLPGIEATLLERTQDGDLVTDADGSPVEITDPHTSGELALRAGWPSMFRGYLDQDARYQATFVDGWYRSGDLARRDADGYYWFVGRGDDVIKTAGHLIGPFEVESVLDEHPGVVESAVIGKPDETAGTIVKAFVVLARDRSPSDELRRELIGHSRAHLGAAVAPREIEFVDSLPHTRSGKIMRRLLKARELGEDEGDISALESNTTGAEAP
ncbi:MAG: acetate--CoA ligase [Acidimicrobiales bacterium]|nr:MAG: acetate--CoA ligase [Acidimicrobiales bacterium]